MRIVLDLQACQASSKNRGIGRYSMSLAQAMLRQGRGHDFRIALSNLFPDSVAPMRAAFAGLLAPEQILVYDLPSAVSGLDVPSSWRMRAAECLREHYLASLEPDLVHVASLFEGLTEDVVTSVGHANHGFDTAVTLYDLIPLLMRKEYLSWPPVSDWYFRKLHSAKRAEVLLAISAHSRKEAVDALQLPDWQVSNISSAVDGSFQPRLVPPQRRQELAERHGLSKPFLMYTGGIDYRKNIEGLIEAFSRLPNPLRRQYQLAIVCKVEEAERQRLLGVAAGFGLARGQLIMTGFVSEEDLIDLYNCTALFIFPSLQEGFGLPALEAMACGAPVIGSNTSSIPEVIGCADALFDPYKVQAIADKIHSALTDDGFLSTLRAHGLEQAKLFSWDASAKLALEAFEAAHARRRSGGVFAVPRPRQRPRLAYVSPLPPERSGIADYSAELLPELARHYEIELVVEQETVSDPWAKANFPVRSAAWFDAHAGGFDRILYHFGNSTFHQHMFDLLPRHPGVVVLHDFYLSGVQNYVERHDPRPNAYCAALYHSHGYQALADEAEHGREQSFFTYPINKAVLDQASGVIVHSKASMQMARKFYGADGDRGWRHIPLLKARPAQSERAAARARLGLAEDDFLVCSFGMLARTKLNQRLLDAWLNSALAADARCQLVFVGENAPHDYGDAMNRSIAASPGDKGDKSGRGGKRIKITGFTEPELYRTYLQAADAAVQLRTLSRGETSAAILDCLVHGLPTIINANGSAAELPATATLKLEDSFAQADLEAALLRLRDDPELRAGLSRRALDYVLEVHSPARIGDLYRDAIEGFADASPAANYRRMLRSLAALEAPVGPGDRDVQQLARCIAANRLPRTPRQLLVDVAPLVAAPQPEDGAAAAPDGARQVARALLRLLVATQPGGARVEPVLADGPGAGWHYARRFGLELIGRPELVLDETPLEAKAGDVLLRFELTPGAGDSAGLSSGSSGSSGSSVSSASSASSVSGASSVSSLSTVSSESTASNMDASLLDLQNHGVSMAVLALRSVAQGLPPGAPEGLGDWLAGLLAECGELVCVSRRDAVPGLAGLAGALAPDARQAARLATGVKDGEFVLCALGKPDADGLMRRLVEAWREAPPASAVRCHLMFAEGFAGEGMAPDTPSPLAWADAAVWVQEPALLQLPAAVLECLASGVPTLLNIGVADRAEDK